MKLAISTQKESFDAPIHSNFGRAPFFILADDQTGQWTAQANPVHSLQQNAGVLVAEMMYDHGVEVVISGDFGPFARQTLAKHGIKMFIFTAPPDQTLTARELVGRYLRQELTELSVHQPTPMIA